MFFRARDHQLFENPNTAEFILWILWHVIIILMLNLILDHFLHRSQSNEHSHLLNQSDALLLYHLDLSNDHGHTGLFIRPIRTVKINNILAFPDQKEYVMTLSQWKYSKISTKLKKKESVYYFCFNERPWHQGIPNSSPSFIHKLKKVRRLCENCYQFKEMNPTDRDKLMEVSMYELILVS